MTQSAATTPIALCVLGMHRSGTSALTGLLGLLGVELGRNLLDPGADNPKGFWELRRIVECQSDLLDALGSYFDDILPTSPGWENRPEVGPFRDRLKEIVADEFAGKPLWGFKDPRTCRLLPLWRQLFEEMGVDARYVLTVRNPDEVAASLASRSGHAYNVSLLMSLIHMLEAERQTRSFRRVFVTYDQLMQSWQPMVQRIGSALGIEWPHSPATVAQQAGDFIESNLRHHHDINLMTAEQAVSQRNADPRVAQMAFSAYELLASAANGGELEQTQAGLDRIAEEFSVQSPRISAWRAGWSAEEKYSQLNQWTIRMNAEVQRLSAENQEMRLELARRPSFAQMQIYREKEAADKVQIADALARAVAAQEQAGTSETKAATVEKRLAETQAELEAIYHSVSWEASSPIRAVGKILNKLRGQGSKEPPTDK
jgi:hypothetical protein